MNDSHEQFEKVESSPRRRERTYIVLGGDQTLTILLARALVNRRRAVLGESKVAFAVDLATSVREITISEVVDADDAVLLAIDSTFPRELPTDLALLEAHVAKAELASWKEDKLGSQLSNYGPPTRSAAALRKLARKGQK